MEAAFLMDQHGLKQTDLATELGARSVVSEELNGRRLINVRQANFRRAFKRWEGLVPKAVRDESIMVPSDVAQNAGKRIGPSGRREGRLPLNTH